MLSHALLVDGRYTTSGFFSTQTAGVTIPTLPSRFRRDAGAAVNIFWYTNALFSPIVGGHVIVVGRIDQTYSNGHSILTPVEARSLDSKYDDGTPTRGRVRANTTYGSCYSGNNYRSEDVYTWVPGPGGGSGIGCALFFAADF